MKCERCHRDCLSVNKISWCEECASSFEGADEVLAKMREAVANGKVEFATAERLEFMGEFVEDFMLKVFDNEPGSYFLSDESTLDEFDDEASTVNRIREAYGVDASSVYHSTLPEALHFIRTQIAEVKK